MQDGQPEKQPQQPSMDPNPNPISVPTKPNYKPSNKLQGKVALVTEGESGIGQAVCYHFALEGATVAFTYAPGQPRVAQSANDTLRNIQRLKADDAHDPIALSADVSVNDNCRMVVDEVVNNYGRIDVLVNNAAEKHMLRTAEGIDQAWLDQIFRTNIFSYHFMIRHAIKHMKEGSSIINSTSSAAYCGCALLRDYCVTKVSIVAFNQALSINLAHNGVRVNGVAAGPGCTPLPVPTDSDETTMEKIRSQMSMGMPAQPHEIAPSYVFLASDDSASFFSGQVLHPNGGTSVTP